MKILHCCLACFYIDNYSYQENLLPKFHKAMGHDVRILASTETFVDNMNLGCISPSSYVNEHGIPVTRLPYKVVLSRALARKMRKYLGVAEYLNEYRPDVIFFHGPGALELSTIVDYVKTSGAKLFIDNHADHSNSATNWVSKQLLHKLVYKPVIQKAIPYTEVFWGTLPARCDFLREVYGVPEEKIKLLVMGADDDEVARASTLENRLTIRSKFGFGDNDFVVCTGGKFDSSKRGAVALIDAVAALPCNVKLILFGPVSDSISEDFFKNIDGKKIIHIPWADTSTSYDYFSAADMVCFPNLHTVYWEQAAGMAKPLLVRRLPGANHVDACGNVVYLDNQSTDEIMRKIEYIRERNADLRHAAEGAALMFRYSVIAGRSIGL